MAPKKPGSLSEIIAPPPEPSKQRRQIAVSGQTHESLTTLCEENDATYDKVIDALLVFYNEHRND